MVPRKTTKRTSHRLCNESTSDTLCKRKLVHCDTHDTKDHHMDMQDINKSVISEFRANDGKLSGPMAGAPIMLLTTTGRRSGSAHTTPVGFIDAGGRLVVAAANGGSDEHPDWYRNIEKDRHVTVEVPGASIPSIANIASGDERSDLLRQVAESLPGMSDHVSATTREIPIVIFSEAN